MYKFCTLRSRQDDFDFGTCLQNIFWVLWIFGGTLKKFVLLIVATAISACSQFIRHGELGTDTGNPSLIIDNGQSQNHNNDDQNQNNTIPPENLTSHPDQTLQNGICESLKRCHPTIDVASCETKISNQTGLPKVIGFSDKKYKNLNELGADPDLTEADFNVAALELCLQDLSSLTCTSEAMINSWNISKPNKYNRISSLLKQSLNCRKVGY
jgi:hypothetical protein